MSFQCSQEKRSDFCSGYKGTRHVVFNARKKADLMFVLDTRNHNPGMLFSMLARKRTRFLFWIQEIAVQACCFQCSQENEPDFCFGCKKSRHFVFNARKKTNLIFVFGTGNPGMCHSHSPHHQDSVEQQSAAQESVDLQPPTISICRNVNIVIIILSNGKTCSKRIHRGKTKNTRIVFRASDECDDMSFAFHAVELSVKLYQTFKLLAKFSDIPLRIILPLLIMPFTKVAR